MIIRIHTNVIISNIIYNHHYGMDISYTNIWYDIMCTLGHISFLSWLQKSMSVVTMQIYAIWKRNPISASIYMPIACLAINRQIQVAGRETCIWWSLPSIAFLYFTVSLQWLHIGVITCLTLKTNGHIANLELTSIVKEAAWVKLDIHKTTSKHKSRAKYLRCNIC